MSSAKEKKRQPDYNELVSVKGSFEDLVKLSVKDIPQIKKQPVKKAAKKKK